MRPKFAGLCRSDRHGDEPFSDSETGSSPSISEQSMRNAKELLIASKVFTVENRGLSWWYLLSSLALYLATLAIACSQLPYWVRIPSSMINGLIIVRLFIIYHDYHHGAILRRSWVAGLILRFYGLFVLSPSSVWNHSHEHHHRHNSRSSGPNVGSFPLMTTDEFLRATPIKRFIYAASRHPINIMMGYLTVFLFGMTIRTFISHPKEHWDSLLALVLHGVLLGVCLSFGWSVMILAMIVPAYDSMWTWGLPVLCSTQLPHLSTTSARGLELCQSCLDGLQLYSDESDHALVYRKCRLPPCASFECQDTILSVA